VIHCAQGEQRRLELHPEDGRGQADRDRRLKHGQQNIEGHLAGQEFGAAEGIGKHLVEDAVVAVEEESPGSSDPALSGRRFQ
jgi:hypothetical protein